MQSEPRSARTSVWARPLSLAATYGIDIFSFSYSGYLDVSVHRVPSVYLWIQYTVTEVYSAGFPHSEICGSMDICSSPQLIAAYHVFHRLLVPRHPPCALYSLTCRIVFAILLISHRIALRCDTGLFINCLKNYVFHVFHHLSMMASDVSFYISYLVLLESCDSHRL